jgi:hypothetical protein
MKNNNSFLFPATFVCFFVGCSSLENKLAQSQQAPVQPVEVVDVRKHLFEEKSIVCHGADGTAGISGATNLQICKLDTVAVIRVIMYLS